MYIRFIRHIFSKRNFTMSCTVHGERGGGVGVVGTSPTSKSWVGPVLAPFTAQTFLLPDLWTGKKNLLPVYLLFPPPSTSIFPLRPLHLHSVPNSLYIYTYCSILPLQILFPQIFKLIVPKSLFISRFQLLQYSVYISTVSTSTITYLGHFICCVPKFFYVFCTVILLLQLFLPSTIIIIPPPLSRLLLPASSTSIDQTLLYVHCSHCSHFHSFYFPSIYKIMLSTSFYIYSSYIYYIYCSFHSLHLYISILLQVHLLFTLPSTICSHLRLLFSLSPTYILPYFLRPPSRAELEAAFRGQFPALRCLF